MTADKVYKGSIAIIGGGITGVTLATALIRRGLSVTIYEQAAEFGEIGAGVAFSTSAVRAMKVCSPDIVTAFHKVRTVNSDPAKLNFFFDWYNAMSDAEVGQSEYWFTMHQEGGLGACHRAQYLNEISKLIPADITLFRKRLDTIEELLDDRKVKLKFQDGTEAVHDAVIGADGIKSSVRRWMFGEHPASKPVYTHKYAYRGLIPIDRAVEALGEDFSRNGKIYLGQDGHVLTFPIAQGKLMNVVLFFTDRQDWPDSQQLIRSSDREQIRQDFNQFGATVHRIIDLLEPSISCWAIFDVADVPYFNKNRVLLAGDAGHASSPHQAGGAGIGIEDCAILAELMSDPSIARGERSIESAFKAFNDQRLARCHWFVRSSRRVGEVFDWRSELGDDKDKIRQELIERFSTVWDGQIEEYIAEAKVLLQSGV